ncbi:MAG: hypothetical protein FJ146_12915 [Deltaproteobacteria bacterium]|nr:hypothetical protein [Deltaproteobacteria bacterium]
MIYIAVLIGILLLAVLMAPFWFGPGGLLQAGSSINSPSELQALKDALLKRYVEDERAFKAGHLSANSWEQRQSFLTNRYIDAARRLDFLQHTESRPSRGAQ